MKYKNICKGIFLTRPNRFIAEVEIDGIVERVHVKNTGRCRELLVENATVYLEDFQGRMGTRKLRYSLIAVEKGNLLINMDSQAPNKVVEEALSEGVVKLPGMETLTTIKREKTYGDSRFDFYLEDCCGNRGWLEVKGVTLEDGGIVRFPDAPTERGKKHVKELEKAVEDGYKGYIIFVVQMEKALFFQPNDQTHKAFGDALRHGEKAGVKVLAYSCIVSPDSIAIDKPVKVEL